MVHARDHPSTISFSGQIVFLIKYIAELHISAVVITSFFHKA